MAFRRFCHILLCLVIAFLFAVSASALDGVYLRGDADGDGILSIMDATRVQRVLAEVETDSDGGIARRASVTSESLNILDATAIQRYLAGFGNPYHLDEIVEHTPAGSDNQLPVIHR